MIASLLAADEPPDPDQRATASLEDPVGGITELAQGMAAGRSSDAVGTIDVLKAVVASYGPRFERVLIAYGGDREVLAAHLATV